MRFRENIIPFKITDEITGEQLSGYNYDEYAIMRRNFPDLETNVRNNVDTWMDEAREEDYNRLAVQVREVRNKLLIDTDRTQLPDAPISEGTREGYTEYRQALRDMPQQPGFPYEIVWPVEPGREEAVVEE